MADELQLAVCDGRVRLADAQRAIAHDWKTAVHSRHYDRPNASAVVVLSGVASPFELTPRQQQVVAHRGNLLLEAVPGSGKTRVIVARCAALIDAGVSPAKILVLTFSRRAVGELRTRMRRVLPADAIPDIHTFHGFAARLLAETGTAGHARRLLSEPAERALFDHAVATTPLRSLARSAAHSALFREAAAARVAELVRSEPAAIARLTLRATPRVADLLDLAGIRNRLRERLGVADYDDLMARALRLASTPGSALAKNLDGRYAHVLVDEFQDTDAVQLALLERMQAEVFAVGDALQAIYGFRGAARDALERARSVLAMEVLSLDESFRCPARVCDFAAGVWPLAPGLRSRVERAGSIRFRRAASPVDEAALIGNAVAGALARGIADREIAVLVRGVEPLARLIERELTARGMPVARQGRANVLDDLAVDALCSVLRAFAAPGECERWLPVFAHPVFGIAPLALRLALASDPPYGLDAACDLAERIDTSARLSGRAFARALRSSHALWEAGEPVDAARNFAAESNLLAYVMAGGERSAQHSAREIVRFLDALADVRDIRTRLGLDASPTAVLTAFFACSEAWSGGAEAADDEPGVRVLTVHAAKGLEFDFVIIADAVDDRFPQAWRTDALLSPGELATARTCGVGLGTQADEQLAEERSLWYVAVTRSKSEVLVTWSETGLDAAPQRPSRFIPLGARIDESRRRSFSGALVFNPSALFTAPQDPVAARLERPLRTGTIEKWLACRRQFYYDALLRVGKDERGFKAKLGTLVHRAIQNFHATVRDFRAVGAGAHIAWATALRAIARSVVCADSAFDAFDSAIEAEAALRAADRLLGRYARELETAALAPGGGFQVVGSEQPVNYVYAGVRLSGRIDRIDRRPDGALELVDIKASAFKKDKAMSSAFVKLRAAASAGELWVKATPPANPQLALYRHAKPGTRSLAYIYLEARPKFGEFNDAANVDRLDVEGSKDAVDALDAALSSVFFEPWTSGAVSELEPTRNARVCRNCEFITLCPGYLEDDD